MVVASQQVAPSTAVEGSRSACDKGKRKVVDSAEAKKNCKFTTYSLVMKVALEIEANRRQHNKMITQRQREKHRMEETKEL